MKTCEVDGKKFILIESDVYVVSPCDGCVGDQVVDTCLKLGDCHDTTLKGTVFIWVEKECSN